MKLIIAILLLTIGAFAQNTTYKDGTDCECDSIKTHSEYNFIYQTAIKNGIRVQEKLFTLHDKLVILISESIYHNDKISSYNVWDLYGNIKGEIYYGNDGYLEVAHLSKGRSVWMNKKDGLMNGITTWIVTGGIEVGRAEFKQGRLIGYKHCSDGRMGNESLDCFK